MENFKFKGIAPVNIYLDNNFLCVSWCDEIYIEKEVLELSIDGMITTRFINFKASYYTEMGNKLIIEYK